MNAFAAGANYATGGMWGAITEAGIEVDRASGGAVAAIQDASMYPMMGIT
jgi:hypothetical protein